MENMSVSRKLLELVCSARSFPPATYLASPGSFSWLKTAQKLNSPCKIIFSEFPNNDERTSPSHSPFDLANSSSPSDFLSIFVVIVNALDMFLYPPSKLPLLSGIK